MLDQIICPNPFSKPFQGQTGCMVFVDRWSLLRSTYVKLTVWTHGMFDSALYRQAVLVYIHCMKHYCT